MKYHILRIISLMLSLLIAFAAPIAASAAFVSEEDGLYWDVSGEEYSMAQLYQDCLAKWGEPYFGSEYGGYYYTTARIAVNYTPITGDGDTGLTSDDRYWIWKTEENASGDGKRTNVGSMIVRLNYRISAHLSSDAPEGAGVSVTPELVCPGQSVTITATEVEGYHVTMACGETAVSAAVYTYTPSADDDWTITYDSGGTQISATALTIENDDAMGLCQAVVSDDRSCFTLTIHPANEQGYFVSKITLNGGENLLTGTTIGENGVVKLDSTALVPHQENTLCICYGRTDITITDQNWTISSNQNTKQQEKAILELICSTCPSPLPNGQFRVEYQPFGDLSSMTLPVGTEFKETFQWVPIGYEIGADFPEPALLALYHPFGQSEETVRICYRSEDGGFVATSDPFTITLQDTRAATTIRLNSDVCLRYDSLEEQALLEALVAGVYADTTLLQDAKVSLETELSSLHAGTAVPVTVCFAGNDRYLPCTAQGYLTILPAKADFTLTDTVVTFDRAGHDPGVNNPQDLPFFMLTADASCVRIRFPENLADIAAALPESFSLPQLEGELADVVSSGVLDNLRTALQELGVDTLTKTTASSSAVGTYTVRAVTCAEDYESCLARATLTICPIQVRIAMDDQSKIQGAQDPVFTWKSNFDEAGLPGDQLSVIPTRSSGEDASDLAITATVCITPDDTPYEITIVPGTLHITKEQTPKPSGYALSFDPEADDTGCIAPGAQIEIDGIPYSLDDQCGLRLSQTNAKIAIAYRYHAGSTAHTCYPTEMYVWYLDFDGEAYTARRLNALDNILKYEGTSIRVDFTSNGIRFFSSIPDDSLSGLIRGDLLTGDLAGFRLEKAGTLYKKWTQTAQILTTETGVSSDVFGGKAGNSFRLYGAANGRSWFTGMLTGLDGDAATLDMDILSRPYITLTRGDQSVTLYGGTVQRSIYYVATQNRDYWSAGSARDNFVESLIATVDAARKA